MPDDILRSLRSSAKNYVSNHSDGLELVHFEHFNEGGGRLCDRFVGAWSASSSVYQMEFGFHGTPDRNVAAILRDGLDPARRRGQVHGPGEYFATGAGLSLLYSRGGRRVIVFALLADPAGITARPPGMVVVHRTDHQLPIGVATFSEESSAAVHRRVEAARMAAPRVGGGRRAVAAAGGGGGSGRSAARQARPQLSGGGAPVARASHASHRAAAAGPAGGGARASALPGPRRQLPPLPPPQRTN